jgi:putative ABC transport system substrate-binding protein
VHRGCTAGFDRKAHRISEPDDCCRGRRAGRGFRQGLREHGYVEGSNIAIEYRFAEYKFDRLPGLAAELVRLPVDVLATVATQASLAAQSATSTIPIVISASPTPPDRSSSPRWRAPAGTLPEILP